MVADPLSPSFADPSPAATDSYAHIDELNARAYTMARIQPREALGLTRVAAEAARCAGHRAGEARAFLHAAACRMFLGELDAARELTMSALAIFDELGDRVGRADGMQRLGAIESINGDYADALRHHLTALSLQRAEGNREGEALALNSLGNVYRDCGDYAEALETQQRSLAIYEELGDALGVSLALNNVGNIHGRLGDYAKALECHQRTLELKRTLGHRAGEAIAYANIGYSHAEMGDHARALECCRRALELSREAGDRPCEAGALGMLSTFFRRLGDFPRALEHAEEALRVSRAHGMRFYEVDALENLGLALAKLDRATEALECLDGALTLARAMGAREQVYNLHRALADLHETAGDPHAALLHLREFHRVKEEVFNTATDMRIHSILVRAEVERTEREAELLRQKNEELDRLSREDALTGLDNRRQADERLALEVERARRFGRPLSVALLDVDHFKAVNDRHSHAVGDEVLRTLGRLLRASTRPVDVVGRYGGEEFLLVLVEMPPERAAHVCERLRAAVEAHAWSNVAPGLRVTVSVGLAGAASPATPEQLLATADACLYDAKRAGRNRVCHEPLSIENVSEGE